MDNTTTQEAYESYIYFLCLVANLALILYSNILAITQEVEYIWRLRKFSLPSLLYVFARYGLLFSQAMGVAVGFLPSGSACNNFLNVANSFSFFSYIGVQGLLVARAYALCKGHKVMAGLLGVTFFPALVLYLFQIISFHKCFTTRPNERVLLEFIINIFVLTNDVVVGAICLWNVWEIWKMKREAALRGGHDLAFILIEQLITRFIFVLTFTITVTIIANIPQTKNLESVESFIIFQNTLSAVLICDFTLDLRQRNSASIASMSTLQFQSVLQHIHESFIVELGDNNQTPNANADNDDPEPESVPLDHVVQDQSVEITVSATA